MGKKVRLSQCMIVKNEEKNIEKALSWGKGIVYEQIVVDTGSTDRTVEIARQMGAKVCHYPWQGDFSAAKNYAIDQASGDWIAFLDADESFTEEDAKKIPPLLERIEAMPEKERYHVIKCTLLNIDDKGKVFSSMQQARLFQKKSAHYKNKIHEQLNPKKKGDFRLLNVGDTLIIYHTGYAPSAYRATGKLDRNISIIRDVLRNEPENWDFWSYLGDSLFINQNFPEAVAAYEKVIRHMDAVVNPSRLDMAFINLVRIIIRNPGEEAEKQLQDLYRHFEQSGSGCPDVDYWMGIYFLSQGNKPEGCRHLERTLKSLDTYNRGASLAAAGELKLIYSSLEFAYAELGDAARAVKYGVLALRLDRFQAGELTSLISLMKNENVGDVIDFFGKLYDFSNLKDKLFLMKSAKEAGAADFETALYQLLSPEERRWLDRASQSPYALSASEQAARYPSIACRNRIDERLMELLEEIRAAEPDHLLTGLKEGLEAFRAQQGNYDLFINYFYRYGCWGRLFPDAGIYEAFENRIASLRNNWDSFLWLYGHLCDYRSKRVLTAILDNWMHLEFRQLEQAKESAPCFIDLDLIPDVRGMTYLDFSTGDFDSVWDFIQAYGETYQDIYCYSKEGASESQLIRKITACRDVAVLEELPYNLTSKAAAGAPLLMKLDVEADLMPMLDGFDELITGCRPLLALCVDDGYDTVWMAAKRISGMDPSYRFYLRYYGGNLIPTKYVLFAL